MTRFSLSDGPDHARQLIDAYLLDDLDEVGARQLAQHVRGCPGCAAELGGSTRLLVLLRTMPEPAATADLDERIIAAALADRALRVGRPPLVAGLARQIFRGAMRTTGTVVVTIVSLALIGGAFVFAASQFISLPPPDTARATLSVVATPTAPPTESTRSVVPTASPETGSPTAPAQMAAPATSPAVVTISPTPAASSAPPVTPSPDITPGPTASPEPTATPSPTPSPTPIATASPSATPTASPSDTPTPSPDVSVTPVPRRTPIPSPSPVESPAVTPTPFAVGAPSTSP